MLSDIKMFHLCKSPYGIKMIDKKLYTSEICMIQYDTLQWQLKS